MEDRMNGYWVLKYLCCGQPRSDFAQLAGVFRSLELPAGFGKWQEAYN